jgi:2-dehydro-3-deoxyglucarate aldolase/4-hydroxy-2-oxoheptanedioate aldolase
VDSNVSAAAGGAGRPDPERTEAIVDTGASRPMTGSLRASMADDGTLCLGSWVAIGHPVVADVKARAGPDVLVLDTEHATTTLETIENMVRAVEAAPGRTRTVVRVPTNDPTRLKRVLDIGVDGVQVPMVDSAAEAEALVAAVRYPPSGTRGIAGTRATGYGADIDEYVTTDDSRVVTIAQIESPQGVANVEEIVAVDGIDAVFLGHADLAGRLDCFGDDDAPALATAVDRVVDACRSADCPVGTIVADPHTVDPEVRDRYDYLILGKDITQLRAGTERAISEARGGTNPE